MLLSAAPEASADSDFDQRLRTLVSPKADVFSLGAVLLVIAVWIILGPEGVEEFETQRRTEAIAAGGIGATFHNNNATDPRLLSTVKSYLLDQQLRRKHDVTTPRILNDVVRLMLEPRPQDRQRATWCRIEFQNVLARARKELETEEAMHHVLADALGISTDMQASQDAPVTASDPDRPPPLPMRPLARQVVQTSADSTSAPAISLQPSVLQQDPSTIVASPVASQESQTAGCVVESASSPGALPLSQNSRQSATPVSPWSPMHKPYVTVHEVLTYNEEHANAVNYFTNTTTVRNRHEANKVKGRRIVSS